ncbi:hypothetical protein [Lacisediminimonas sp.]|uniref:hypothetical protein n=1 Tax=Lacisediminimonas sp. TaxID=3060582 RepID=UPI00272449F0|nr:hypothetical protein [Lacisediminimonas sp.]MDO8300715.1 hypothetical protein [Lacisediminimonas sp.]MDO9216041.1 hypothetical protein [Lacisediminimonas sp.]
MSQQADAEEMKRRELEDRAKRPLIVHETVPGEAPIVTDGDNAKAKEKAQKSTSDEDLC